MTARIKLPYVAGSVAPPTSASIDGTPDPAYPAHPSARLSIANTAKRAGVCSRTVKRWIAAGLLAATRLPSPKGHGHLRVRLGDLEALLAQGTLS
jgi:hypothetical protein